MTLMELKQQVMFQTGTDADDLGDFEPHLTDYLNEGYGRLAKAFTGFQLDEQGSDLTKLRSPKSQPDLPEWMHRAIADYGTWMAYRNGSAARQSRGYVFKRAFEEVESRAASLRAGRYIHDIPL